MAQQIAPVPQFEFGGVVTDGHPLKRPPASAAKCDNIRVMPGNWIRLRGGRDLQYHNTQPNGRFRQFYEVRLANGTTSLWHFAQYDNGSGKTYWAKTMASGSGYLIFNMEEINRGYGFSEPGLAPIATVRDRVFLGNGLGCRSTVQLEGGTPVHASYPALTQWDGTYVRFVGLDNYCPTLRPTVTATPTGAGTSSILYSRTIYVGLMNTVTGHFGNGLWAGEVASGDPGNVAWEGNVSVGGLNGLTSAVHPFGAYSPSNESAELKYVFWVTGDGGEVPYLAVNTDGSPVTVDYGGTTKALVLTDDFLLDVTQEMPTENFPPRAMSSMCYANGRVYGALAFGTGSNPYVVGAKDICAVVWSAAADDVQDRDFVGVPEESWPHTNRKYTPNGERPLLVVAAQEGTQVLVLTHSGTFLLEETADGLHIWSTVSNISGIWDPRSFVKTPYGFVWLDQRKQIVLLAPGTSRLQVLSGDYQKLLGTVAADTPADYLLDPPGKIDRYQIWIGGGKSVIHDFALGGQAYTASGQDYTAAATMLDPGGFVHHIVAKEHVWTHEASPFTGLPPVADQNGDGTYSEINGEYIGQWNDYGDASVRKEFKEWAVIGDCAPSAQLGEASPVQLSWYGELRSTESPLALIPASQDDAPECYRAKVPNGNRRWIKLRIRLNGHHSDAGATFAQAEPDGDLAPNVYGSIWESRVTINGGGGNR